MIPSAYMTNTHFRIGIIGGGSVGLTYAALLSEVADVVLNVRRSQQADAINSQGILFKTRDGQETVYKKVRASVDVADLADCDAILIAVKSYDTAEVADKLAKAIKPDTTVVTLQNGLQALDILESHLENPSRVLAGVTYVGANRSDDRQVLNGHDLRTIIDERATELAKVMQSAPFTVETSSNIKQTVWNKMAFNVAQNALSAITNRNFGQMLQSPDCLDVAAKLLSEFQEVAASEGIHFEHNLMDKLQDNWRGSSFYPSMWQDLHHGKRTEIDAINGMISLIGRKHAVPTPTNDVIISLIKALETAPHTTT